MVNPSKHEALTARFAHQLAEGKDLSSITKARQQAAEILGEPVLPGTALAKQVDEAIEVGVVRAAKKLIERAQSPPEAYRSLVDLYHRQPPLTVRSSTSVMMQAYSTPIPIAYLASKLANINGKSSVYEPSAGHGSLLLEANPLNTTVNELDPNRAAVLRSEGFTVSEQDACAYLSDTMHDAIVMNPPFCIALDEAGRRKQFDVGDNRTVQVDHAIALQALKTLKPEGRAVLILNSKLGGKERRARRYGSTRNRDFYKTLYQHYNVTDHFTIAGRLYRKQGTEFPIDVIVINGWGQSSKPLPGAKVPHIYQSFDELGELLEEFLARESENTESQKLQQVLNPVKSDLDMSMCSPIQIQSVREATMLLHQGLQLKTPDQLLSLGARDGGQSYVLRTPKGRQVAGKYFLNRDLLAATKADFYSTDKLMQCSIPAKQLEAVLNVILENNRWPLVTSKSDIERRGSIADRNQLVADAATTILQRLGQPTAEGTRAFKGKTYELTQTPTSLTVLKNQNGKRTPILAMSDGKIEQAQVTSGDCQHFLASLKQLDLPRSSANVQR